MQEQHLAAPKQPAKKPWYAYNIVERKGLERPIWLRVGCAWHNQDGSFSIVLDSFPVGGKIHIREDRYEEGARPPPQRGQLSAMADQADA